VPTFLGVNGAAASCCSCAFSRREDSACSGAFSASIWCFPSANLPSSVECFGVNGAAGPAGIDGAEREAWAPGSSAGRRSCGETWPRPSSALDRGLLSDSLRPNHPHCHAFHVAQCVRAAVRWSYLAARLVTSIFWLSRFARASSMPIRGGDAGRSSSVSTPFIWWRKKSSARSPSPCLY